MVAKRERYKKQGKDLLHSLSKKITDSLYGDIIRRVVNDQLLCVTEIWMGENYVYRVEDLWLMMNGNLIVKQKVDAGVDDQDIVNSNNQMPRYLGSHILGLSKLLMNIVIPEKMNVTVKIITTEIRIVHILTENTGQRWLIMDSSVSLQD